MTLFIISFSIFTILFVTSMIGMYLVKDYNNGFIYNGWVGRIQKRISPNKCQHLNRTEITRCYQDRYVKEVCNECGTIIYTDI